MNRLVGHLFRDDWCFGLGFPIHRGLIGRHGGGDFADEYQFDAFDYSTVHWSMTVVFIVGVALSAIFQTSEVVSTGIYALDTADVLGSGLYTRITLIEGPC
jgi:hypothetical protein